MINMILFGLGIAILCVIGLFFARNKERAARRRRQLADESDSIIILTRRESLRVLEMIETPPRRNARFLRAQARHKRLFDS